MRWMLTVALVAMGLSGCAQEAEPTQQVETPRDINGDDVVVIAVLDWQINPYHYDFLASQMPQHMDSDDSNDLPLDRAPHEWVPGFPDPDDFDSYTRLDITMPSRPEDSADALYQKDADVWDQVRDSDQNQVNYHYFPGTKVIGMLDFAGGNDGFADSSHGVGASSVSVGNIHGACPHCVLVFVNVPAVAGEEWVRQQSWIDASTHSYESSSIAFRDNIADCDTSTQKAAVERGQQIFWAAGNGLYNTFTLPQSTLVNCEKAPDWIVTVGAIEPESGASFTGHGKPVNVANVGIRYPSAGGGSVTAEGSFGGTSNATPVTAGMYGEALYRLRSMVTGDARTQQGGIIIDGAVPCGSANADCAFADGSLAVHELREALFRAATHTDAYFAVSVFGVPAPAGTPESEYLTEGHGSFYGRTGDWAKEIQAIVDHATGNAAEDVPQDLRDFMIAYSYCVQEVWGHWDHGYWKQGDALPTTSGQPLTTWMATACPDTVKAAMTPFVADRVVQPAA